MVLGRGHFMSEKIQEARRTIHLAACHLETAVSQGCLCSLWSAGAGLGSHGNDVLEIKLFELWASQVAQQ